MIDWSALKSLSEEEARDGLAEYQDRFENEHAETGAFVDIEVMVYGGATVLPGGTYDELLVPDRTGSVLVEGDLALDGILEQPFRSAPLLITGDLTAAHLVTCGMLVVLGNVKLGGVFYGNCTNYFTVVYGDFEAEEIIREKNHLFGIFGSTRANVILDDEEDGYEATAAWMEQRGASAHDETTLAKILRG